MRCWYSGSLSAAIASITDHRAIGYFTDAVMNAPPGVSTPRSAPASPIAAQVRCRSRAGPTSHPYAKFLGERQDFTHLGIDLTLRAMSPAAALRCEAPHIELGVAQPACVPARLADVADQIP